MGLSSLRPKREEEFMQLLACLWFELQMTQGYLCEKNFCTDKSFAQRGKFKMLETRKQNINTMNAISVDAETNEKLKKAKLREC
jgi:hypothetical protein